MSRRPDKLSATKSKIYVFSEQRVTLLTLLGIFFLVLFTQNVQGASPFGSLDVPTDGSTVRGTIQISGWVLDDVEVAYVQVYRNDGGSLVYLENGALAEGQRPDVTAAYPHYPHNQKAGFSYSLPTHFLPDGGNSSYTIHVIATDNEGNKTTLGIRTIHCDNNNGVNPFGLIDTPWHGAMVSGSAYINWGWVLTPQPNNIPIDGSTITVYIDGVNVGSPVYNLYRSDIASMLPGYANSNGAAGYFTLDTTAYTDGVHTILWAATDSGGNSDSIDSRYITIQNGTAITAPIITTTAISGITTTTASGGGNITSDGGDTISARGVCWSTSANPLTSSSNTADGKGTGTFTSALTNLIPDTTYHVRAYAVNSKGVSYGNDASFRTGLDLTSAILALQIAVGIDPSQNIIYASDANDDGKVGIVEAIYILEKLAGLRD